MHRAKHWADLVVIECPGANQGDTFALRQRRQKVGSAPSADVRLTDSGVSKEHALIWSEEGVFHLQDEASSNGTFLNGNEISLEVLYDGDEIQMGNTRLVFRVIPIPPDS